MIDEGGFWEPTLRKSRAGLSTRVGRIFVPEKKKGRRLPGIKNTLKSSPKRGR